MQKIYLLAIAMLCLFSACKKDYLNLQEPEIAPLEDAIAMSSLALDGNYQSIMAPSYNYYAGYSITASGVIDTLFNDPAVGDYSNIIRLKLMALEASAGGTLYIMPGKYQCGSSMGITMYYRGFANQRLNIIGLSDDRGNAPLIFTNAEMPHKFFYFECVSYDDVEEVNIDNIRIQGNNQKYTPSHPFYGSGAPPQAAIMFANINRSSVRNTQISDVYGDGVLTANWSPTAMSDYNINEYSRIYNVHILNCWSENLLNNSGDGITMNHVGTPDIRNCVISNDFSEQEIYGRGGIVLEGGTVKARVTSTFIQGYRAGIICEQDFGGHRIQQNTFAKNKYAGITFAHDTAMVASLPASSFYRTSIASNIFLYNQTYLEYGANHFGFIIMDDFSYALNGMVIRSNRFLFHEDMMPSGKIPWMDTTLVHPFNVFIQTWGAAGISISTNSYVAY